MPGINDEMLAFDDFFVQVFGKTNMRVLTFLVRARIELALWHPCGSPQLQLRMLLHYLHDLFLG